MDIGVKIPNHGLLTRDETDFYLQPIQPADVRPFEFAQLAERLSYHSIWLSDHVVMGGDLSMDYPVTSSRTRAYPERPMMLDVAVLLGGLAHATERIRFAPSVHIAPYRHPLASAHQFATADQLSEGRVIMGVGSGWEEDEFRALGADFENRGEVTEECIEIYKKAWSDDWIDHDGKHFTIHGVSMDPKPYQQPRPPIVYGATTPIGARRAARQCDGLYTVHAEPHCPVDFYAAAKHAAIAEGERIGKDMSGFWYGTICSALLCDSDDPILRGANRPTMTGTAEDLLEELERYANEGYGHVTLIFDVRSNTIDELFDLVTRFGEEVLPEAQKIEAAPFV